MQLSELERATMETLCLGVTLCVENMIKGQRSIFKDGIQGEDEKVSGIFLLRK